MDKEKKTGMFDIGDMGKKIINTDNLEVFVKVKIRNKEQKPLATAKGLRGKASNAFNRRKDG